MDREEVLQQTFLNGGNASFILDLYQRYLTNQNSVTADWQHFFASLNEQDDLEIDDRPPLWKKSKRQNPPVFNDLSFSLRIFELIQAYRQWGHLNANLDPLNLEQQNNLPELQESSYGFTPRDLERSLDHFFLGLNDPTLQQVIDKLKSIYCGTVGVEFIHIQHEDQRKWIQERIESPLREAAINPEEQLQILKNLVAADSFERFLQVKYPGTKRFGLEGGDSLIPALSILLERAREQGIEKIVLGMAHRGRLNVLANILKKPFQNIFAYFQGSDIDPSIFQGSGDVKYHLGFSSTHFINGKELKISLMSNPSHLEAVNPIILGKVRGEQETLGRRVLPILIHGDAAFAGQGLVAETLELSSLKGYQTGGSLHIIMNNQVGFTTPPLHSRSSPHSSDIAKTIQSPIFHVNADDPESVIWVTKLAIDFQRRFAKDVVIDLVCYRRHGHNEIDEPSFTQPIMYKAIATHPPLVKTYASRLINLGKITTKDVQDIITDYEDTLRESFEKITEETAKKLISQPDWLKGVWSHIQNGSQDLPLETGVSCDVLEEIGKALVRVPDHYIFNPRLMRLIQAKQQTLESGKNIDWATGEALALGTLLVEGRKVRLSGQDVGRGTFSHRHSVWVDQKTERKYIPLNHIRLKQAHFEVVDSPLAEASILGFEYGLSLANPEILVVWEAQFGDFANGAQVIIDQFISSGEHKWNRLSGLVILLPHGYEGQGPEHSSARQERYLQLCAQDNLRVMNCSTPANYFHVLRRQLLDQSRKPLVVMTPKSLLRHKLAVSSLEDMGQGTTFIPVYPDEVVTSPKRVLLCSGKVFYELFQERERYALSDVAIVRLEQYYPFPEKELTDVLRPYASAEFFWCQEEPKNMGAWNFLDRRLERILQEIGSKQHQFFYVGRLEAASPATGNGKRHEEEQRQLLHEALKSSE